MYEISAEKVKVGVENEGNRDNTESRERKRGAKDYDDKTSVTAGMAAFASAVVCY